MNDQLFLSLLAMDAYSRGYLPALYDVGDQSIGDATYIRGDSSNEAQGAGFFAGYYDLRS